MGLEYVIFVYHHRPDPDTPFGGNNGAPAPFGSKVERHVYAGISSYQQILTAKASKNHEGLGTPLLIHQT